MPPRTRESAAFFDALIEGRLVLQECRSCDRRRAPIAPVCPYCGGREFAWRECGGGGAVHSWVRYRRGYLPEFEPLMPYDVLCVALDEGPRIFGRLAQAGVEPEIGMRVSLVVERFPSGECAPAFITQKGSPP